MRHPLVPGLVLLVAGTGIARPNEPESTPLRAAVEEFNQRAKLNIVGVSQSPLTEDEVVAAIRGWIPERQPASPETLEVYREIAETRTLPPRAVLDFTTRWVGFNGYSFEVWWIDLTIRPAEEGKPDPGVGLGYTFRVRDQKLSSRPLTEEEKSLLKSSPQVPPGVGPRPRR